MQNTTIVRQGDVLLVPTTKIPTCARAVNAENGRLILARGEATGHHHSIALHPHVAMFRDERTMQSGVARRVAD